VLKRIDLMHTVPDDGPSRQESPPVVKGSPEIIGKIGGTNSETLCMRMSAERFSSFLPRLCGLTD